MTLPHISLWSFKQDGAHLGVAEEWGTKDLDGNQGEEHDGPHSDVLRGPEWQQHVPIATAHGLERLLEARRCNVRVARTDRHRSVLGNLAGRYLLGRHPELRIPARIPQHAPVIVTFSPFVNVPQHVHGCSPREPGHFPSHTQSGLCRKRFTAVIPVNLVMIPSLPCLPCHLPCKCMPQQITAAARNLSGDRPQTQSCVDIEPLLNPKTLFLNGKKKVLRCVVQRSLYPYPHPTSVVVRHSIYLRSSCRQYIMCAMILT